MRCASGYVKTIHAENPTPWKVQVTWIDMNCSPSARISFDKLQGILRAPSDQRCHTMQKWHQAILPGGSGCLLGRRKQFNQDCRLAVHCSVMFSFHYLFSVFSILFSCHSKVGSQHICLIHHTQNLICGHLSCIMTVSEQPSSWVDFVVNEFRPRNLQYDAQMVQLDTLGAFCQMFCLRARWGLHFSDLWITKIMDHYPYHKSHMAGSGIYWIDLKETYGYFRSLKVWISTKQVACFPPFMAVRRCSNSFTDKWPDLWRVWREREFDKNSAVRFRQVTRQSRIQQTAAATSPRCCNLKQSGFKTDQNISNFNNWSFDSWGSDIHVSVTVPSAKSVMKPWGCSGGYLPILSLLNLV